MALTAAGVGSGLDVENIVSQLMQLESRPLYLLQDKEDELKAQLSAYGQLKSALSTFQTSMEALGTIDKFKLFSTTSSDEDVVTVTADSAAAKGTYDIEVTRLAQRHKVGSDAVADTDTFTGDLTITIGSDSLVINPAGNTLEEIRDLINNDETNPGVTASIINVGSNQQRLVLTSDEEGYEKRLQFSGSIATSLNLATINTDASDVVLADLMELDAAFSVDGYAVTSASNNPTSVIDGLTFDFKQLGTSTVTVNRDTDGIVATVQSFISAFNNLQTTTDSLLDSSLEADSTPLSMQNLIRGVFNTAPSGLTTSTYTSLAEIGISTDAKTGTLSLDSTKLEAALTSDFNNVAELFGLEDEGYAARLASLAESFLDADGLIDSREDGINARIKYNQNQQTQMEYRLDLKETSLRREFATLDSLIGSLQSTSSYLASALVY
ncbi:MAG: flagellar filament capping protein FliD [Chromatiales bacterium]|jgi:flagellar hook-associated protein 2